MIAHANDVLELTGYSVDDQAVMRAQAIVEVVAGRPESAITRPADLAWIRYAICWQAAYMDSGNVYEQANVQSVTQDRSTVVFGERIFAVSELVIEACKRLSWNKSKAIYTKPYRFDQERMPSWWTW